MDHPPTPLANLISRWQECQAVLLIANYWPRVITSSIAIHAIALLVD
jgi:hypothetical protein